MAARVSGVNENVLVVPAATIQPALEGPFTRNGLDRCLKLIQQSQSFLSRPLAEEDPTFKQIIPYVVIRHGGQYFLTRRTKRQSEARLHGKFSLGIGGHINDTDDINKSSDIVQAGLERELAEEVHLGAERKSLKLAGVISDDSTPVGQVHLGLVFILELQAAACQVRESELMTSEWADRQSLEVKLPLMETWSQIVFENLIAAAGR